MSLYICEKPSQGRDLAKILGISGGGDGFIGNNEDKVTWAIGHMLTLFKPEDYSEKWSWKLVNLEDLPMIPNSWEMKQNPNTKKQLKVVQQLLKQTKHVIISTDGDREGEVIGREVLDYFDWSGKIERLWLTALDDNSIHKSLKNINPNEKTINLYYAGLARARSDWLVGMSLTVLMTLLARKKGYQEMLNIGRVQTPTLAIVVNRDLEIENFVAKDYYDISVVFQDIKTKWNATKNLTEPTLDPEGRCLDRSVADEIETKIKNNGMGIVSVFETELKKVAPPLLYSLSKLQQDASKKFGFGAKQVLNLAQSLYEKHKATTYPRSDCQYLPEEQLSEAKEIMAVILKVDSSLENVIQNADLSIKSKVWNNKKLSAHHAIIPTFSTNIDVSKMTTDECKLYDLIVKSYISQFYSNYEYNKTSIKITSENELFETNINVDKVLGWKVVINPESNLKANKIPDISIGQSLSLDSIEIETKQTKPPTRYTEGTLIAAMEKAHLFVTDPNLRKILSGNEGLGTEATRANIIDLLIKRKYIDKSKRQLISSISGRALIKAVPMEIKDPGMTAIMESSLSKIETGELTFDAFMDWQIDWLRNFVEIIKSQGINIESNVQSIECPCCKKNMFLRSGRKGQFWACSGYPTCKTTAQNKNGKAIFQADLPDCPKCGKKLNQIKGKKGVFWSCKGYFDTPKCEFTAQDKAGKPILI